MKKSSANSTPLLLSALILALLVAIYYFVVMPKSDDVTSAQLSVASLQSSVSDIQNQIDAKNAAQTEEVSNEFAIRKQLPAKRGIEELLLNIEEMEYATGTLINAISFNSYDTLVNSSGYVDPNAPVTDTTTDPNAIQTTDSTVQTDSNSQQSMDANTEQDTTSPDEVPVSTIDVLTLPTNLKMITFNLEVEAPNEQQLLLFLKEIEKLERVMHVDTISFALPGEENMYAEDASDVVNTTVQVTMFYYE